MREGEGQREREGERERERKSESAVWSPLGSVVGAAVDSCRLLEA